MTTYHTTGTVSVTNGSTAVTGSGTDWATALITAGVIYIAGTAYPIASVESNTALTLAIPYAGSTAPGLSYAIDRQSVVAEQTVTNAAKLAALLEILPTFSEFAKDELFNDADAAAMLSTLGVSAFMQTLMDDADAAAFWTTIGATAPADKAFRRGNILGTVSQSGGVPTGTIIEQGSNANGSYVRFADGTQICINNNVILDYISHVRLSATWTYPSSFAAAPATVLTPMTAPSALFTMEAVHLAITQYLPDSALLDCRGATGAFETGDALGVMCIAIGRWF